jgi:hypothetical protein
MKKLIAIIILSILHQGLSPQKIISSAPHDNPKRAYVYSLNSYKFNYVIDGKKGTYQCSGEDFFEAVEKLKKETQGKLEVLAAEIVSEGKKNVSVKSKN